MPKEIKSWKDFKHLAVDLAETAPKKLFVQAACVSYSGLIFEADGTIKSATLTDSHVITENRSPADMAKILQLVIGNDRRINYEQ